MVDNFPSQESSEISSLPKEHNSEEPSVLPTKRSRSRWKKIALLFVASCLIFVAWFIPPVYWLIEGPVIVTRYTKKNGEMRVLVGPKEKDWVPFHKMSRHFVNAVIAAEDGKFYQHQGLDLAEIKRSYEINKKKNRYVRGGSTITQQVVKMAFLGREKTLVRKAREAVGALILEVLISKEEILSWYLNLVELGDGVYGIAAGSHHYFKTKPELLTIEQSVHLALVLPSPNAWSKGLRNQNLTPFGHRRFSAILNRMRQSGNITSSQWMTSISRGNFGRPIQGYASLLAREEALKKESQDTILDEDCINSPECENLLQDETQEPKESSPAGVSPSSGPSISPPPPGVSVKNEPLPSNQGAPGTPPVQHPPLSPSPSPQPLVSPPSSAPLSPPPHETPPPIEAPAEDSF